MNEQSEKYRETNNMNRRNFLKLAGGAAVLSTSGLASLSAVNAAGGGENPRDVVLIITDQQHLDTIAAGGNPYINTPALDAILENGVSFTESYCSNPVCSPARSSIFSGRTSSETGVYTNGNPIRMEIPNLGQWVSQETDMETVYAGKWHLPRGFTHFIPGFRVLNSGISGQGNVCDTSTSMACDAYIRNLSPSENYLMVASFMQPHDICEWLRLNTYVPDEFRYPDIQDDLPPLPPNFTFDFDEPEAVKEKRAGRDPFKGGWTELQWRYYIWSYYRHIEQVDAEVGRILQALEDTGRREDTLIIFTSDHGEGVGEHQMVRKSFLYDAAVAVPFLISWPKGIPQNRTNRDALVSGMDIFPTICDYLGIDTPEIQRGTSVRPVIEYDAPGNDFVISEARTNRGRMVRTNQYKYISFYQDSTDRLFDMKNDPHELNNLAADGRHADVLKHHRQILSEWEQNLDVHPDVPRRDAWWYGE